jgi:hypothetical protein
LGFTKPFLLHLLSLLDFNLPKNSISFLGIIREGYPDTANADKITAEGKHGVLKIIIPKREKVAGKKIRVEDQKD